MHLSLRLTQQISQKMVQLSVDVIENDSDIDDANDALSVSAANIGSATNSADDEAVEIEHSEG